MKTMHVLLGAILHLALVVSAWSIGIESKSDGTYRVFSENYDIHIDPDGRTGSQPMNAYDLVGIFEDSEHEVMPEAFGCPVFFENGFRTSVEHFRTSIVEDFQIEFNSYATDAYPGDIMEVRQVWRPNQVGASLRTEWIAHDDVLVERLPVLTFGGGDFDSVVFLNVAGSRGYDLINDEGRRFTLQNGFLLRSETMECVVDVKNPFYGDFIIENQQIYMSILPSRENRGREEGPPIRSHITAGDTIRREMMITFDPNGSSAFESLTAFASPSPHPNGATGSLVIIGDEFPLRSAGTFPTIPDDPDDPLHGAFVRMLMDHPSMRLGMVVSYDLHLRHYRQYPNRLVGWYSSDGNVSYTPFDSYSGSRSLRMELCEEGEVWMRQPIQTDAPVDLRATVMAMIPSLLEAGGFKLRLSDSNENVLTETGLMTQPMDWTEVELTYSNEDGLLQPLLFDVVLENTNGSVFVDDVSLMLNGEDQHIVNAGFELGETRIQYDSLDYSWWNAHTNYRLLDFPQEYQDFLLRVQNDEATYGWEDRVSLGIHAYHHSPYGGFVGSSSQGEFTLNRPEDHARAFDEIFRDAHELGLDERSLSYFRSPGIQYQDCTVQEALRKGIRWMDQSYAGDQCLFYPVYGEDGSRVWLHGLNWWGDNPESSWSNFSNIEGVLDQGGIALMGFHPFAMLDMGDPERYQWVDEFLTRIEDEYPNATWMLPNEVADLADNISNWRNFHQYWYEDTLMVCFRGEAHMGETIALIHTSSITPEACFTIDGVECNNMRFKRLRTLMVLPELEDGYHLLKLKILQGSTGFYQQPQETLPSDPVISVWPVPSNGYINCSWSGVEFHSPVSVSLYNLLGQEILQQSWNPFGNEVSGVVPTANLASGYYYLRLKDTGSGQQEVQRVLVLK